MRHEGFSFLLHENYTARAKNGLTKKQEYPVGMPKRIGLGIFLLHSGDPAIILLVLVEKCTSFLFGL